MGLSFRLGSSWGCNGGGGVSYTTVRLEGGVGGALTYSCKLSGSLWYFLNQYHQARPGGGSMSISFKHKESMEKKNSHSISSSIQSVYIVYMFTTGPWWGIRYLAQVLYDYLVRLQCTYLINSRLTLENSRFPGYYFRFVGTLYFKN